MSNDIIIDRRVTPEAKRRTTKRRESSRARASRRAELLREIELNLLDVIDAEVRDTSPPLWLPTLEEAQELLALVRSAR